jgi:serine/threonine protein kinase
MLPVSYAEDEEALRRQVEVLLLYRWPAVVRVLDMGVFPLRAFSCGGFMTRSERVAAVTLVRTEGLTLLDYVHHKWEVMRPAQLRYLLLQVARALALLHGVGILHRNLHPAAVVVSSPGRTEEGGQGRTDEEDVCVLEDMWFLHNPRMPGCAYSAGRSDWGNVSTRPPEVSAGSTVSDRSDVYALGVCMYAWAGAGMPRATQLSHTDHGAEALVRCLPPRWGIWLPKLVVMCLSPYPSSRPSAEEVVALLANSEVA